MKSGRPIDISKSSLISLKAELSRKQEEVKLVKGNESYIKLPPTKKKVEKINSGVAERNRRDLELTSEEVDLLKKSRSVLEIKASIYEKLHKGELVSEDSNSRYLVDFGRKSPGPVLIDLEEEEEIIQPLDGVQKGEKTVSIHDPGLSYKILDEEWIEYTDCLGRSRKCHKTDLDIMKEEDIKLSKTLDRESEMANILAQARLDNQELMSNDTHLEQMKKKWDEKEKELLYKDDIHYEDVLFNEARSHGVGYWKFSTDAEQRKTEQDMLKKVREETEKRQKEAKALRDRRDQQKQARLIAARQRQRARIGLPPLEIPEDALNDNVEKKEPTPEPIEEDLESKLKKAAHVRPWDIGKDGTKSVMSQEEWNEKKRSERHKEFAPVYSDSSKKSRKYKKFEKDDPGIDESEEEVEEEQNPFYSRTKNFLKKRNEQNKEKVPKKRGAEIPPPMDFDYHTPAAKKGHNSTQKFKETADAIEAGLRLLREQQEHNEKAKPKGSYYN